MSGDLRGWHDESDRLKAWGSLDPTDACMCVGCTLREQDYPPGLHGSTTDPTP